MADDDLTPDQQQTLDCLAAEMLAENAQNTLERWVDECVAWRRMHRAAGVEPVMADYIRGRGHAQRAKYPKLVMHAMGAALWERAEEVEKRG